MPTVASLRALKLQGWQPPREILSPPPLPTLAEFVRESWQTLEPGNDLLWNWHLDAICEHIEAALLDWSHWRSTGTHRQRFTNLLINVPPGSMKSRIVSVCAPAWFWLHQPGWRAAFLSANPRVAMRDSVFCRDLIESPWYQQRFRPHWHLRQDQNTKSTYWNSEGGIRSAFGFASRITGDRFDALFVDDPHDAQEVESDTKRQAVLDRWDAAIRNRVSSPKHSIRVGIMQRLADNDWSGHVLRQDDWAHLVIPQEFEADRAMPPTPIGWVDPRTEDGDLMFPARFPPDVVAQEKLALGEYRYAGQHQQRPAPRSGNLVKREWIQFYDQPPTEGELILSWDTAGSDRSDACPWVCTVWAIADGKFYLLDVFRKRMNYPTGKKAAIDLLQRWQPAATLIEEKSTGQSLIQELRRDPVGGRFSIVPVRPTTDKVTRFKVQTAAFESGRVLLPQRGAWVEDYLGEILRFPASATADQVDSTSQFLQWASGRAIVRPLFGYA